MKIAWRIVLIIVAVAAALGAVCIGVGFMTGGNIERIMPMMDSIMEMKYGIGIDMIRGNYQTVLSELLSYLAL